MSGDDDPPGGMDPSDIPDTWPPGPGMGPAAGAGAEAPQDVSRVLPLFPLEGVFLLPRQVLPLQVFEPRYRQLVEDVLDRQGRFVMATVLEGERAEVDEELEDSPPRLLSIGGLGEIARHEKTPDGRYLIWLLGLGRQAIEETDSDRLYRQARTVPLAVVPPTPLEEEQLTPPVRAALEERSSEPLQIPDEVPLEFLADALSQKLQLPQSAMEPIFCEPDVAKRARMVLEAHEAFPPPV